MKPQVEDKFKRKQEKLFACYPELRGKVTLECHKKSMAVQYGEKIISIGYNNPIPRNIYELFETSPRRAPRRMSMEEVEKLERARKSFLESNPIYAPFSPILSIKTASILPTCSDNSLFEVRYGSEAYSFSLDEPIPVITFRGLERYIAGSGSEEESIKRYIIDKSPSYADFDFSVSVDPLRLSIGGYSETFNLTNIPPSYYFQQKAWFFEHCDSLRRYALEHMPVFFADCHITKAQRNIKLTLVPSDEMVNEGIKQISVTCPIPVAKTDEEAYAMLREAYQAAMESSLFDLNRKGLREKIGGVIDMASILKRYEEAGYYKLSKNIQMLHPLYTSLTAPSVPAPDSYRKSGENRYILTHGLYEVEFDLAKNSMRCISTQKASEIKSVKPLVEMEEKLGCIREEFLKKGYKDPDVQIQKSKTRPPKFFLSSSKDGMQIHATFDPNDSKKDIRAKCRAIEAKRKEDAAEAARQRLESIKKMRGNKYYGDLYVADLLKLILKSSWDPSISYIKSSVKMSSGVASAHTISEAEGMVRRLCRNGILKTRVVHSRKYDDYEVYCLSSPEVQGLVDPETTHYGRDKKYGEYTDVDWQAFLHDFSADTEQSLIVWKHQLPVWDHVNVLITCQNDLKRYYKAAPEQIQAYLSALSITLEDRLHKRLLKAVIS